MGSLKNEIIQHYPMKLSPTKRRPSIAADVVDILSDLQTKNYVSANQVGDVLRRTGEFWSNFEYAPDRLISKQSAIRSIVIKGVAADLKIVQFLSEMTHIWIQKKQISNWFNSENGRIKRKSRKRLMMFWKTGHQKKQIKI